MDSNIKEKQSKVGKAMVFDDISFSKTTTSVTTQRAIELENTLGKALMEKFKNEFPSPNQKK